MGQIFPRVWQKWLQNDKMGQKVRPTRGFSIYSMCVFFMPENRTEWDSGTGLGQRILRNCPVKKWLSYGIILYYGTVGQIILYLYI